MYFEKDSPFPHMLMIENMLLAVAALPAALGAVAEIHSRVASVGDAADRTAVERLILTPGHLARLLCHLPPAVLQLDNDVPGEEEEEIGYRGEDQQTAVPAADQHQVTVVEPGEQGEPSDPDRQDEKYENLEIGIKKGEGEEDRAAEVCVAHRVRRDEEGDGDGHQVADQQEDVVAEGAPLLFEGRPHQVEEVPGEKSEKRVRERRIAEEGGEPPPFPRQEEIGGEVDLAPVQLAGHEEDVEDGLAGDQVDGQVRQGIPAKLFLQLIKNSHN